jgi:phosphate transport system substrate-binding protein
MTAKVMKGLELPPPLLEETSGNMGGIIIRVADYRNYSSAIGYSFRFFATDMSPNQNIKLLAVDGVEPTVENIRSGAYPFTIDVYAVTAGSKNENVPRLISWLLSEQGQALIEQSGYVGR